MNGFEERGIVSGVQVITEVPHFVDIQTGEECQAMIFLT